MCIYSANHMEPINVVGGDTKFRSVSAGRTYRTLSTGLYKLKKYTSQGRG